MVLEKLDIHMHGRLRQNPQPLTLKKSIQNESKI
jgi:hypothetical protein